MPDDRLIDQWRMNKTAFSIGNLDEQADDRAFWRGKSVHERLRAIEYLRQINYGQDRTSAQLQRVLTVAELGEE